MLTKRKNLVGIIIFVVIWGLIFAIPKTRLLFEMQFPRIYSSPPITSFPSAAQLPTLEALIQKYPHDAEIQALLVANTLTSQNNPKAYKERLPKYDALIRRFPDDTWLITDRLRQSTAGQFKAPEGSYTTDYTGKHFPLQSQNWLSVPELKQMLKIVLLGERKDPQNSFYNWMEAYCWYGLDENDKALDALQRGSQKSTFDDGTFQDVRNRDYVQQLIMTPLLEDRIATIASELLPHYAIMRNMTRVALWQGTVQEKAGNHQRALDIYGSQIRLSMLIFRHPQWLIGQRVALAMLNMSWLSLTRKRPDDKEIYYLKDIKNTTAFFHNHAQRFADYAHAHGRADLAAESLSIASSLHQSILYQDPFQLYSFLSNNKIKQLGLLKWTGILLLRFTIISISLLIFIEIILALITKLAAKDTISGKIPLQYSDTIICSIFILLCAGAFVGIYLSQISQKSILYFLMMMPESSGMIVQAGGIASNLKFILGWVPWMSSILLFIYCLLPSWWKMRKSTFGGWKGLEDSILVILGKIPLAFFLLVLQTILVFWILSLVSKVTDSALVEYCIFITIPIPCILFLFYFWRREHQQTSPPQFSAAAYWMRSFKMLRNSLALLILICSLAYGATSFASLPLRNQANASLDHFIKVGEVQFLREGIQRDKPHHSD